MLFAPPIPVRKPRRVPRDYQIAAVHEVGRNIHRRPLLVAPTGSGKTFMGSLIVSEIGVPTLWLAHRIELIDQAAASLRAMGLRVGIIKAGRTPDPGAMTQVASIQSLARRECPPADLIVIDEAHHVVGGSYQRTLEKYPGVPTIGLSATPFRLDGRGLGTTFGHIVVAAYTDDLVAEGFLHAPKVYASEPPDLRGLKIVGGDYVAGQLAQRMAGRSASVLETWRQRANGLPTIAFCVNVAHSMEVAEAFNAAGIPAEHLDGTTDKDTRAEALDHLRSGETKVICNCDLFGEGVDLPLLGCAILFRPTASLSLHLQQLGRIMRVCEGKTIPIALDHAGNHHRHGLVTRRLNYSLDGSSRVGSDEPLGLRQCKGCFVLYSNKLDTCPECGLVHVPEKRDTPDVAGGGGTLGEFVEDFEYRRKMWQFFEAEREANGYKPGWSLFRFEERFGHRPVVAGGELVDPGKATMEQKEEVYRGMIEFAESRGLKSGWASHKYREAFGVWPKGFVSTVRDRGAISERWERMRNEN